MARNGKQGASPPSKANRRTTGKSVALGSQATTPAERRTESTNRPYFGIQEPEFSEGGGFGRHFETAFGESQEGSRNASGATVKPPVPQVPKKRSQKDKKS